MAKHFDPEKDVKHKRKYSNAVKIIIETEINGKTFTEQFGFDHSQYPDGGWEKHVDRAIETAKESGMYDDDPEKTTRA